MTKNELLSKAGAEYLIDDQPKHCVAAARAGVTALLFGSYGWSERTKLEPGMVRVRSWPEVMEYFDGQA